MNEHGLGMHLHHDDRYGEEFCVEPAAWTAPRTWVTSELVTSSIMNTHVRDNFLAVARVFDRNTSTPNVVSDALENTIITKSIPGGTIGTSGVLRLTALGDYLNNSGVVRTLTPRVKFGGTTLWGSVSADIAVSANRRSFRLVCELSSVLATNVQFMAGLLQLGPAGSGANGGFQGDATDGALAAAESLVMPIASSGTVAIDTTSAQTLLVSVQHSASDPNLSLRLHSHMIELLLL